MDALADEYAASCARARRRACAPLLAFLRAPGVQLHCDLSRCASPLADDGIARCAAVLARDASLRSLDVSHNAVGALGARELGRVLITQGLLHTLTIADNRLDCEALGELARALLRAATDAGASALTALDLSFNHIEAEGAASLAAALRARPRGGLRTLVLSGNRIGPVGAEALASALRADVSLQTLRLRACHIGDTGAAGLGAAACKSRARRARPGSQWDIRRRPRGAPWLTPSLSLSLRAGLGFRRRLRVGARLRARLGARTSLGSVPVRGEQRGG